MLIYLPVHIKKNSKLSEYEDSFPLNKATESETQSGIGSFINIITQNVLQIKTGILERK